MAKTPTLPPLDMTTSSSLSNPRRVAYYYDPDIGNYVYYLGHPMKPHRIRMAHNLIVNYGLTDDVEDDAPDSHGEGSRLVNDEIMSVDGGGPSNDAMRRYRRALTGARGRGMQVFRPKRATKGDMTRFHTDEYVELLEQVTPETSEAMTGGGTRCTWSTS